VCSGGLDRAFPVAAHDRFLWNHSSQASGIPFAETNFGYAAFLMVTSTSSGNSNMIQLNRILVPTDFSEFSRPALDYACAIAARFQSELHVLHVTPDPAMIVPEAAAFSVESMQAQAEAQTKEAQQQLADLPGGGWDNGRPIIREVRTGAAFLEILEYAKTQSIDLIVIGTHGRTGLMHVLMGSVAEKVVRKSPCPVLTVKPAGHQFVTSEL